MDSAKIKYYVSNREYQFIEWVRSSFKAGHLIVVIHNHEPQKVVIEKPEVWFDGNVKKQNAEFRFDR